MTYRFTRHYTRDEARAMLPRIRVWLAELRKVRSELDLLGQRIHGLMLPGADLGGPLVNQWIRTAADLKEALMQFYTRQIQLKDVDRGLLDFPAIIGGKEVFLCWEEGEDDVEFWHDLETGYAGREPLE